MAKLVYSTDAVDCGRSTATHIQRSIPPEARSKPQDQTSHASRYISAMYDSEYVADLKQRIAWYKALVSERWEYNRLDWDTQARVDKWWTKRIAKGTRFEGGADVATICEGLTQKRYALEAELSYHTRR